MYTYTHTYGGDGVQPVVFLVGVKNIEKQRETEGKYREKKANLGKIQKNEGAPRETHHTKTKENLRNSDYILCQMQLVLSYF